MKPIDASPHFPANAVRNPASPQGTGGPATAGKAWAREMERAQIAHWFQPMRHAPAQLAAGWNAWSAQHGDTGAAVPAPLPPLDATPRHHTGGFPWATEALQGASPPSYPLAYTGLTAVPEEGSAAEILPPSTRTTPATHLQQGLEQMLEQAHAQDTALPPNEASAWTQHAAPGDTHQAAFRIHTEQVEGGVAVWIGAHPDSALLHHPLPLLIQELRRSLQRSGAPLQSLTINGQPIWGSPDPTRTTESPSQESS